MLSCMFRNVSSRTAANIFFLFFPGVLRPSRISERAWLEQKRKLFTRAPPDIVAQSARQKNRDVTKAVIWSNRRHENATKPLLCVGKGLQKVQYCRSRPKRCQIREDGDAERRSRRR